VAPEEVAGVGRRRPGGCPDHDSGCHAALDDQLGAEPRSPVAARLADEPGLDWTAGAQRRQLAEPPRQGEWLAVLGTGKGSQPRGLLGAQWNLAPTHPDPVSQRGVPGHMLVRIHHLDLHLVKWPRLDHPQLAIGQRDDDP